MEDISILENNFNAAYKEYKDYHSFLKSLAPDIQKSREDLAKTQNKDEMIEKAFEVYTKPHYYAEDLIKLQNKLRIILEFSSLVLKIPAEIKEEIENFTQQKQLYRIDKGEAIEIDPDYVKQLTEEAKRQYRIQIEKSNLPS